ncbi:MAG: aromatic ring-hydroxylating dioxygenase subunit alpha [Burkholderiales bacterium]
MRAEQNELITRIGPGTPAGGVLRSFWQPVALTEELAGPRPCKAVRLLGQDLVLFRDESGRYGLLDRNCPHRGADLSFGRLEDGGLRCAFHGWLFDVAGQCLETPAEPEGSTLCQRIRQRSYPVAEKNGIIFAYLGAGAPPAFPRFDCFVAPEAYTFAFKGLFDCNWLQALEVGIDPAHTSFLHRFFEDGDPEAGYGKPFRDRSADTDMTITQVMREYARPDIRVSRTEYGMRVVTLRRVSEAQTHVRVTNLMFPNAFVIPMSLEMTISQWHVPVDDTSCYWYAIFTSFGAPVDKATMRRQRLELYELPDYRPRRNRTNQWGYDSEEQQRETFTGMGQDINVHDQWAIESQGRIQDRTREHLGTSDRAIIEYRRLLIEAVGRHQEGASLPMRLDDQTAQALIGPGVADGVGPSDAWEQYWTQTDARRRKQAPWIT